MQILNKAQKEAVSHFEGPMLILAGPGSGKTRVITERIHTLIYEKGVLPGKILVITFTKAAAQEMRERYQNLYSSTSKGVHFGTFHAVFFMILKYAYHFTSDNIIREEVRFEILKQILSGTDLELQDENEFIYELEAEISRVKGERMDLNNYYSPLCSAEVFRDIFYGYRQAMEKKGLIDFDDMLVYCYELLKEREDILKKWQHQFQYILIDEFQDISLIQYDIVKMLASPENNLFVVGDDDQSIYGFRGARPDIMRYFLKDYPDAGTCVLNVNYRSAAPIVEMAETVIEKNSNRLEKTMKPSKNHCTGKLLYRPEKEFLGIRIFEREEEMVSVHRYTNVSEENEAILKRLLTYNKEGVAYRDMAVLYRTNMQSRALAAKLMERRIPFIMKEQAPNLYHHWMVRDVLAYIRIALGSRERQLWLQIINRPKRYVHRSALTEKYVDLEDLKQFYQDKDWMTERLDKLRYDLDMLSKMRPFAAVNFIRRGIGYDDYIKEYAAARGIREESFEVLEELSEEAKNFDSFEAWFSYMDEYEKEMKEQTRKQRNRRDTETDAVVLLTMHGAKGLEYECVFIPDANEGVIPHSKSVLDADMEEERRMFYVAVTRAKKHLHISYLQERFNKQVDVSRFVEEMLSRTTNRAAGEILPD